MNVRVGESGERSVRAEKASQQAESFSHTKSRRSGRRGKSPDNDDEVINAESTRSLRRKVVIVQNIQMNCRESVPTIENIEKIEVHQFAVLMSNDGCGVESQ